VLKVIRIKYIKSEKVKFVSHLETMKVFQRAIRRIGLKAKYSQGFNQQMQLIFALPLPVNVLSDSEYVDLFFNEDYDNKEVEHKLQEQMPEGFKIIDSGVRNIKQNIMSDIKYSDYEIKLQSNYQLEDIVKKINGLESIEVEKIKKNKVKIIDIKPLIFLVKVKDDALLLKCSAGNSNNLHPRIFIKALKKYIDDGIYEIYIKRIELYVVRNKKLYTPLDQVALNEE